ncbi:MAG TPA: hypothetical protein ACHBZA_00360 [Arsenophonus apicola]|uniref:hypothetical protein n=1 Tax=Arsenophonus TaxID=637 RepID=UPI0015D95CB3|nr:MULTISPECIES: hypothetical protein [Arsenophonus]UBX28592.1 hypothetical protein LDL57_12420 [Arsenophonus apicola]
MKSLLKTAIVISFFGFSSFSIADTNRPWQCDVHTLQVRNAEEMKADAQWYKENCLPPSNKSTSQTSNEINTFNTYG